MSHQAVRDRGRGSSSALSLRQLPWPWTAGRLLRRLAGHRALPSCGQLRLSWLRRRPYSWLKKGTRLVIVLRIYLCVLIDESSSLLCVALGTLRPLLVLLGGALRVFDCLLRCGSFGLLKKLLAHAFAVVAIDGGGGVSTYASVAGSLLRVFACCFLASHFDNVGNI